MALPMPCCELLNLWATSDGTIVHVTQERPQGAEPPGAVSFCLGRVRKVTCSCREKTYVRSQKGGLNDAHVVDLRDHRHHGGGRTWRVLLASPAGGADATSKIG